MCWCEISLEIRRGPKQMLEYIIVQVYHRHQHVFLFVSGLSREFVNAANEWWQNPNQVKQMNRFEQQQRSVRSEPELKSNWFQHSQHLSNGKLPNHHQKSSTSPSRFETGHQTPWSNLNAFLPSQPLLPATCRPIRAQWEVSSIKTLKLFQPFMLASLNSAMGCEVNAAIGNNTKKTTTFKEQVLRRYQMPMWSTKKTYRGRTPWASSRRSHLWKSMRRSVWTLSQYD